ncbi:hypothetical protein SLI_7484 [Streptomyces lividans 1326]|uniref:Uncharacterized protein n=1 Tax=Streptomyces lividans 1326 TaxID=1200984 RepID=A0A7U9HFW9_STRLI|nr:hypothetical protein SLI_7484 [Streptomyces lividans 1326]
MVVGARGAAVVRIARRKPSIRGSGIGRFEIRRDLLSDMEEQCSKT